ncbi:MAG: rhomboid family intramembrane serine protease [bacterium]
MIPLKTSIAHKKFPLVTLALISANCLVFLYELSHGHNITTILQTAAVIPAKYFTDQVVPVSLVIPLFSSMFLHASILHILSNMWFLWIFGQDVEARMGRRNFFLFYISCGILASLTHIMINATSHVPVIGASGAIAGVLGSYIFLFPRSQVITLVPIFVFLSVIKIPSLFLLGYWFLLQFLNGMATIGRTQNIGGIAWWVHIAGFISGAVLLLVFAPSKRRRTIE